MGLLTSWHWLLGVEVMTNTLNIMQTLQFNPEIHQTIMQLDGKQLFTDKKPCSCGETGIQIKSFSSNPEVIKMTPPVC